MTAYQTLPRSWNEKDTLTNTQPFPEIEITQLRKHGNPTFNRKPIRCAFGRIQNAT